MTTVRCPIGASSSTISPTAPLRRPPRRRSPAPPRRANATKCYKMLQRKKTQTSRPPPAFRPDPEEKCVPKCPKMSHFLASPTRKSVQSTSERPAPFTVRSCPFSSIPVIPMRQHEALWRNSVPTRSYSACRRVYRRDWGALCKVRGLFRGSLAKQKTGPAPECRACTFGETVPPAAGWDSGGALAGPMESRTCRWTGFRRRLSPKSRWCRTRRRVRRTRCPRRRRCS